jgi:hypothetical protein
LFDVVVVKDAGFELFPRKAQDELYRGERRNKVIHAGAIHPFIVTYFVKVVRKRRVICHHRGIYVVVALSDIQAVWALQAPPECDVRYYGRASKDGQGEQVGDCQIHDMACF